MGPISEETLERIKAIKQGRHNIPNADYWRRLNPECRITDRPFPEVPVPYPIAQEAMARHLALIRKEGYFQTPPIVDPAEVDKLRRCITTVVGHGHDASYALLYDEFYHVMAKLTNVLAPVLGPDFQLVPDEFGGYYIPPEDRASGTPPHRDELRTATSIEPDGTPTLVNVWIPLTDATTINSCIHVLPAHLDPHYPRQGGSSPDPIALRTCDLPSIRALPAQAGSVLCWSTHLVHWGGRSSDSATHPRISFATYYQSRRVPPYHEVTMDIPSSLPFPYRLQLIEKVWYRTGNGPPGVSV
jgi:hypothetical protein